MNVEYLESDSSLNGVIPYVVLLPFGAQEIAIQGVKSYSAHHGYGMRQCAASHTVTEEWVACDEVAKLLYEFEMVLWLPRNVTITNYGVSLSSLASEHPCTPIIPLCANGLSGENSRCHRVFGVGMLVKRCEPVMRLFQAILRRTSWQKVAGGVDKAIDEVFKEDASLRDLLPWCWMPGPKTIRSSVGDARKLESKPAVGWRCGDFIAALERREENEQNADSIDLGEVVSDHGISWSRRGLANRIGPMATDKRHIGWMRTLLLSKKWRASLEVGCLGGASSVAFVDAVNERTLMHAHFCDRRFTREFHQVAQKCWGAYTLHEEDSYECLSRFSKHELDFVYVDGDHSIETLQREYHQLARLKPAVVAAHDVVGDDGPGYLMVQLQRDGYFCLVDCKRRKGEGTHRGFLIACRDYDDYQLALEAYRRHIW